jgi:hypothetical protein
MAMTTSHQNHIKKHSGRSAVSVEGNPVTESSAQHSDELVCWDDEAQGTNSVDPSRHTPTAEEEVELPIAPDPGHVDPIWDIGSFEPSLYDEDDDEDDPYDEDDEDDDFFPDDPDEDFDDDEDEDDEDLDDDFEDVLRLSV